MRDLVLIEAVAFLLVADPADDAETCNRKINPNCDDAVQEGVQKHHQEYDRRRREKQQQSSLKDDLELKGDPQGPTTNCPQAGDGEGKCN